VAMNTRSKVTSSIKEIGSSGKSETLPNNEKRTTKRPLKFNDGYEIDLNESFVRNVSFCF
jgi:hypothetical protein